MIEKNTWTGLDDFYSSMTKALAADIVTEKANQLGDVGGGGTAGKNGANGAGGRSTSSMKKSGVKNSKTLESTRRKGTYKDQLFRNVIFYLW